MEKQGSPWGDWKALDFGSLLWTVGAVVRPLDTADFAADYLDSFADATVQGGATFKPTFAGVGSYEDPIIGYELQLAIPDFAIDKNQQGRLRDWSGEDGDAMDGTGTNISRYLLIENVLAQLDAQGTGPSLDTLLAFDVSVKFRGYGAPVVADGSQTEDIPVAATNAAFPDMELTTPSFAPDGVLRMAHIVELPNTLYPGDVVEIKAWATIAPGGRAVQFMAAKYCWATQPLGDLTAPDANQGVVLDLQPRQDEDSSLPS